MYSRDRTRGQEQSTGEPPAGTGLSNDGTALESGWLSPALVALVLTAGVLALDGILPGLPGAHGGLVGRLMAFMSGICPQRPSHSYMLGGVQLPLEARMIGMFGGAAIGVIELATLGRRRVQRWPRPLVALTLLLEFGLMVFDGFNALLFDLGLPHAYAPDLRLRLATGVLAGPAIACALVPALTQVEQRVEGLIGPASPAWQDVGWMLMGSGLFALLVASGWAALLYPVTLAGTGGVVLIWTLVNRFALSGLMSRGMALPVGKRGEWGLGVLAAGLAVLELALLAALHMALLSA